MDVVRTSYLGLFHLTKQKRKRPKRGKGSVRDGVKDRYVTGSTLDTETGDHREPQLTGRRGTPVRVSLLHRSKIRRRVSEQERSGYPLPPRLPHRLGWVQCAVRRPGRGGSGTGTLGHLGSLTAEVGGGMSPSNWEQQVNVCSTCAGPGCSSGITGYTGRRWYGKVLASSMARPGPSGRSGGGALRRRRRAEGTSGVKRTSAVTGERLTFGGGRGTATTGESESSVWITHGVDTVRKGP